MRPLSTDEAFDYLELMLARLVGWSVVLGPHDSRQREAREVDALFRRIMAAQPDLVELVDALKGGKDVVELWPADLREVVRFQIEHKMPRAVNDPTSAEYAASMRDGGRTDYALPDFLSDHGEPAEAEDHPAWSHLVERSAAA